MPKKIQHGGLQTFEQKINNCVSHAESRCIYRIFKYLQKNHKIFEINGPFNGFNIIPNQEYKNVFENFSNLYDEFEVNGETNEIFMDYIDSKVTDANLKQKYKEIHKVQNNQKEIYFTILPILTYDYIFNIIGGLREESKDDRVIKYNNDDVFMSMKHIKEKSFDDNEKKIIINDVDDSDTENNNKNIQKLSTHYFYEFNSLFLENEINNKTEAMNTLNQQIEKFNALISLIPDNLTFRKYHYKNIDDYLTTKKNPIFGIFHFSQDLLRLALYQRTNDGKEVATFKETDSIFGHAVAIYNLKKNENDENKYVLEYKNSFDEVLGDDGKDILNFTKDDLNNNFYKIKNVLPIQAWALEYIDNENMDNKNMDNKNMDNKSKLEKMAKLKVKDKEIPKNMIETINNKLYDKLPIDTNLIEEGIKYLKKNGITDENIEKVFKKMIERYRFIKYKIAVYSFIMNHSDLTNAESVLKLYSDTNVNIANINNDVYNYIEENEKNKDLINYTAFYNMVFDEPLYDDILNELKQSNNINTEQFYKTINEKVTEKIKNKISIFKTPATHGGKRKSKKSRKTKKAKKSRKKNTKKRNRKTRRH